jgi:FkbM family methyltransferase
MLKGPLRRRIRDRLLVLAARRRTIRRGAGAGLRIDATGSNPAYALGLAEPAVQDRLVEELAPGMVMYDVGANIGFFTLIAARHVGDNGRVVAFEPLEENAAAMERNLALNGVENVTIVRKALSDRPGRMGMSVPNTPDAGTRAALGGDGPVVEVARLDDLDLPAPDLVKIDIEGAEVDAVQGMLATLTAASPVLLIEVHDEEGTTARWDALDELLRPLGYKVERLVDDGMAHLIASKVRSGQTASA